VQTHHLSLVAPITDFIVTVENGKIASSGPVEKVLAQTPDLLARDEQELKQEDAVVATTEESKEKEKVALADGRLAVDEEKIEGKVGFHIVMVLLRSFGSWRWWTIFLFFDILSDLGNPVRSWWFSVWSRASSVEENVNNLR
jgi:ABC-type glutathione transport system ATPase component